MSNGPKIKLPLNVKMKPKWKVGKFQSKNMVKSVGSRSIKHHLKSGNIGKAAKTLWTDMNIAALHTAPGTKKFKRSLNYKGLVATLKNIWTQPE